MGATTRQATITGRFLLPRRSDHLRLLLRRGAISQRHFAAALRLRDVVERASPDLPCADPGRPRAGTFGGFSDGHLRAREQVRRTLGTLGPRHAEALSWVVLANGSLSGLAQYRRTREATASAQLRAALGQLDNLYNPPVFGRCR